MRKLLKLTKPTTCRARPRTAKLSTIIAGVRVPSVVRSLVDSMKGSRVGDLDGETSRNLLDDNDDFGSDEEAVYLSPVSCSCTSPLSHVSRCIVDVMRELHRVAVKRFFQRRNYAWHCNWKIR